MVSETAAIEIDLKYLKEKLAELSDEVKQLNKLLIEQVELRNRVSNIEGRLEDVETDNEKQWKMSRGFESEIQRLKNAPITVKASIVDSVWKWAITIVGTILAAKITGLIK
jgi:predicted nuclease with TOPRIM domain